MLDGATLAPLLLLPFRLIAHGESFCLLHVDETCLKLYPWTIFNPTSPCKNVLVNLLFHHCLLVEGSQSLYILSLIIRLVLLGVEYFGAQELFKVLGCLYLHKIENTCFQYLLKPNIEIPTMHNILLFRIMIWHHRLVLWRNVCYHIAH